ncbi:hypothetical protein O181_047729 [Austropuccinia psidii MF-1]|uniref:CCHC-type domain-containing protein n=1 Tax=Austropuccinia psidii MF-1 TaxID=1389203 RepID=A0A9Q3HMB8_9BASI|nr:hypothetical protein [Austropuccinia psidii MF-1]
MNILKKCGQELEYSLRNKCIEPCSTENPNEPFIKKDKPRENFNPNTSNSNSQIKCHKCGGIGHLANNCLKKAKINEIVEPEDHNDKKEESDSERDTEESDTSESYEINIINAQINNIDLIYEVLHVSSNLPQVRTSYTNLKNIQDAKMYRTKPEKGMGYTAGKSSISIVIVENQEAKVNLDPGAYGTCVADKEPLGAIIGNEVDIILNVKKPYPTLLRRPAYPGSPRAREALEVHIKELIDLGVLRKVGHNEQVKVTAPVIITLHNGKSRMVGDFRSLKTYTIPERYPIPRIHETLTQLSQAKPWMLYRVFIKMS